MQKKTELLSSPIKALLTLTLIMFGFVIPASADQIHMRSLEFEPVGENQVRILKIWELTHPSEFFGGLSGMVLSAPDEFLMLSDESSLFQIGAAFDEAGILNSLHMKSVDFIHDIKGRLSERKLDRDSESLTLSPEGNLYIAFERNNRIHPYNLDTEVLGPAKSMPESVQSFFNNKGFEALEFSRDGHLIALEESRVVAQKSRLYFQPQGQTGWQVSTLAHLDRYLPTGLARLPGSDQMILLERFFSAPADIRARLYLFDPQNLDRKELLAEFRSPNPVDNFEAIDIKPAPGGGYHIFVLADDNFNVLQRTLLMQLHYHP